MPLHKNLVQKGSSTQMNGDEADDHDDDGDGREDGLSHYFV